MAKKQNNITIQQIDIKLIVESPLNPRKYFSLTELQELSESIKNQGLLQPITLRPVNEKDLTLGYEIVCGARRFKASQLAEMKQIPAIVRSMTDEEAFDAMITENLQRKDVEPMDEAIAFKALLDKGASFEELATRFGKSEFFIRQRIKLNDLIEPFKEMLQNKKLQVSHALELCKLTTSNQEDILPRYADDVNDYYGWTNKTVKELRNCLASRFNDLDKEEFDKTECSSCEHRCGANMLFQEFKENTCSNSFCFDEKKLTHRINTIVDKVNNGLCILLAPKDKQDSDILISKLKELGYEFNNLEDFEWEWPREDDEKQSKQLESGELKNVLIVGYWHNEEKHMYAKLKKSANPESSTTNAIENLQAKDKRNKEIQGEKTIADLRELFGESKYEKSKKELTESEEIAVLVAMLRGCNWEFKKELGCDYGGKKDIFEVCANATPELKTKITRAFIKNTLTSADVTHASDLQKLLQTISTEFYPEKTKEIELLHEGTYLKRQEKIEQQIKALEE